jgi:hypothetical protein
MRDMLGPGTAGSADGPHRRTLRYNRLPLAVLAAAGIGCLLVSRTGVGQMAADRVGRLNDSLRRWLSDASELIGDFSLHGKGATREPGRGGIRSSRRKICSEEPMAGYGA